MYQSYKVVLLISISVLGNTQRVVNTLLQNIKKVPRNSSAEVFWEPEMENCILKTSNIQTFLLRFAKPNFKLLL